jgi:hypothetical protein
MNWHQKHVETGFYPQVTYLLIDDLYIARSVPTSPCSSAIGRLVPGHPGHGRKRMPGGRAWQPSRRTDVAAAIMSLAHRSR